MSAVINEARWTEWSKAQPSTKIVLFGEYANYGAGSTGPRVGFATALGSPVEIVDILNDGYESWVDTEYLS